MARIDAGNGCPSRAARRRMLANWFIASTVTDPGPVDGLPVRHPRQFGRERVRQPGQIDSSVTVLGDPVPVLDAGSDHRAAPRLGQTPARAGERVQILGGAEDPVPVTHRSPARRTRTIFQFAAARNASSSRTQP